jgi:hypothetical protein
MGIGSDMILGFSRRHRYGFSAFRSYIRGNAVLVGGVNSLGGNDRVQERNTDTKGYYGSDFHF